MLFSSVGQNKCGRLVQMTISGENYYLGHIFQDRLESVIPKYSIHTGAGTDSQTYSSKQIHPRWSRT